MAWARWSCRARSIPDEFYVYKPTLLQGKPAILRRSIGAKQLRMVYSDAARRARAQRGDAGRAAQHASRSPTPTCTSWRKQALVIEKHYGRPMDIEWAKDGVSGKLFIVQARPETVKSRAKATQIERYQLTERGDVICEGRAIGQKIGSGVARVVRIAGRHEPRAARRRAGRRHDRSRLGAGDEALRGDRHQPRRPHLPRRDHRARTRRAGRGRHRQRARHASRTASEVTISCAEGDTGFIYDGALPFERNTADLEQHAAGAAQGDDERRQPGARLRLRACCRNAGIGLARLEMIIASHIGIHPKALLEYDQQDAETKKKIDAKIAGYGEPGRLLRRPPGRGHRHDHRVVRAASGDRAPVGLQVERVRQPDRRQQLRAARREPDDRLPRRQPLRRSELRRRLRAGMPRGAEGARGDGPDQLLDHDPVRAHARRRPQGHRGAAKPTA